MRAEDETDEELSELKERYQQVMQEAQQLKDAMGQNREKVS
jgi:prefoldin subunit 5